MTERLTGEEELGNDGSAGGLDNVVGLQQAYLVQLKLSFAHLSASANLDRPYTSARDDLLAVDVASVTLQMAAMTHRERQPR